MRNPRPGPCSAAARLIVGLGATALLLVVVVRVAGVAVAGTEGGAAWLAFQGGPQHLGSAPDGPQPALSVAWRWPAQTSTGVATGASNAASAPVVSGGLVIAVTADLVVALDASSGAVRWRLARAAGSLDPPAVDPTATPDGVLVFTQGVRGAGSEVVGVDLATRAELWRFPADAPAKQQFRGPPVIADGSVFVGSNDGSVYAIDLATGAKRWSFQTGGVVQTSPAAADGVVFAVGEAATTGVATLFAIDASSGAKLWSYAPRSASLHVSSPTVADGHVFEGFGDGVVRAFDERTGAVSWSSRVRGLFSPMNALAYADGTLFAMDATGALYAMDATSGLRRWDFQFEPTALRSAPVVAGATVYVGLDDGSVAAVEVASGVRVWLGQSRGVAGGLAAGDGSLYVSYAGRPGGIVAFRHSGAALERVESPTVLHLGAALGGYAVAAAVVLAGLLALFTSLGRRRAADPQGAPDTTADGAR